MKWLKALWRDDEAIGEIIKNTGLGVFVNGIYGISDLNVEIFNISDIIVGIMVMTIGVIIERRKKWDIG